MTPRFFGQYLLEKCLVSSEQLLAAIKYQENSRKRLGDVAIECGFMNETQVREIHDKQKTTDKYFGELAIEAGYLDSKKFDELVTRQKNSHVFLGEALVALKILPEKSLATELGKFKVEQDLVEGFPKELDHVFKGREYAGYFIDLTERILTRMAGIASKAGSPVVKRDTIETGYLSVSIPFSGDIALRFCLSLNREVAKMIACRFLEEDIDDDELIAENAAEFLNVVCGNIVTRLERDGKRTSISIPQIVSGSEQPSIALARADESISVPLATVYGDCEIRFIVQTVATASAKKILIVDDSKSVAYKLNKIVEEMPGFNVVGHALSGEEGVELFQSLKPDLVTMDLVLPGIDGIEATRRIRAIDADANIVIISSVGGGQERLFDAIQAGARNVITKPFNKETVKEIFAQLVS